MLCNSKLTCKRGRPSVTIKSRQNSYLLKVTQYPGRIFCSYFKLEELNRLLNGHLAAIKSLMLQKGSKNSLKCFRGQIYSETKTADNQCWNDKETHRRHDLSVGKDNICSVKNKNAPQHTPLVFLWFKF